MSAPAPVQQPLEPPAPDPKLNPADLVASLPQAQLENLRYKIQQIMESINGLMITLTTPQAGGIGGGLAGWPELMTKYSVLLSKTHSLAASLSAPPTRKGQTSLKAIAPTPFATHLPPPPLPLAPGVVLPPGTAPPVMEPQHIEDMLDALLDGRRSQGVLKTDIANVARLRLPKDPAGPTAFGGGGISIGAVGTVTGGGVPGVREGPMSAEELRAEQVRLDEVIRAHDARCARGVEAVRQLKDKYDWKQRLLFDDSDPEIDPLDSEPGSNHDGQEDDEEGKADEDMVEVAPDQEDEQQQVEDVVEMEDETPPVYLPAIASSDSESEDDRPLAAETATAGTQGMGGTPGMGMGMGGVGANGDVGDDGSESDGMEDLSAAPSFIPQNLHIPPPQQVQYNGANGNTQAEASPVSALDNLFAIDP